MLAVPCVRRVGGLAMMWKAGVDLHVQTFSLNHIDTWIMNNSATPWRLIGFYGRLEAHRKHESWELLRHLHSRDSMSWLCVGDYNEILSLEEKRGCLPQPPRPLELAKHYYIAGWVILASLETYLPGGMGDREGLLFKRGWIGHVQILNGGKSIILQECIISMRHILIMKQFWLPHRKSYRLQEGDESQKGLKRGGHQIRLVRGWFERHGKEWTSWVALCTNYLKK